MQIVIVDQHCSSLTVSVVIVSHTHDTRATTTIVAGDPFSLQASRYSLATRHFRQSGRTFSGRSEATLLDRGTGPVAGPLLYALMPSAWAIGVGLQVTVYGIIA